MMLKTESAVYSRDAVSGAPVSEYDPMAATAMSTGAEKSSTENSADSLLIFHSSPSSSARIAVMRSAKLRSHA